MKKGIKEVLQTEMLGYTAPVIINNLPSIDGLLVSQREVIYAMNKAKMNSSGAFYKMLKATGRIFDYYVLGDAPLEGVMKNMANNYILNRYLIPKGSFGNKNLKDGTGSAPRYIECKLDKYAEYMLEGINKNSVEMKWNYDATEKEPIILPSPIPNILTNLRMSISVSEANKMPSHNLIDSCDAIISYIDTHDIDKSIGILKCPDLPSGGGIIYNKKTFDSIYKTGKGSFINVGKCKFDKITNTLTIYEIPYMTYIENINDEIESKFDKFKNEVEDFHNGTDREGLKLELYLKKGANVDIVIQKLRKYTSYEKPFSCNFTILDLNGKLPVLCTLEDIINKWITHRTNCIKNETQFDIDKLNARKHIVEGFIKVLKDKDNLINLIKNSSSEQEAKNNIKLKYNIDDLQSDAILSKKISVLTKMETEKYNIELKDITSKLKPLEELYSNNSLQLEKIKEQLEEVKQKFGKPRQTEIIQESDIEDLPSDELIEEYFCNICYTDTYIKKHLKQSDNHKTKENEVVKETIKSNNTDTLLIFTDKANRYKIPVNNLNTYTPSQLGDYIYNITTMDKDEKIIKVVSIPKNYKKDSYMVFVYDTGKIAKINIESYLSNNKKLQNCYNTDNKLIAIDYITKDSDIFLLSEEGKALIINTERVNSKSSRNSQGVTGIKLNEGYNCIGAIINVTLNDNFKIETEKEKVKEYMLDDVVSNTDDRQLFKYLTGRPSNGGNFVYNTRPNNDKVINFQKI